MLRRRSLAVLVSGALALTATACSGEVKTETKTPEAALKAARDSLANAKSVAFALKSEGVPTGQNGVTAGEGKAVVSASEPKFEGTITGTVNGLTGNIAIICVGEQAWWKLFTPDYTMADLKGVDAPNPCTLFNSQTGIGSLVDATTGLTEKGKVRVGRDVLTTYAGTLPGKPINDLLHLGDGTGTFEVTYGVTDKSELRQATMTGPFFTGSTSTYTVTISDYGTAVTITPPM